MTDFILQEAEKLYIIHGVQDNLRNDGRGCLDYREIELETDVIPNSNGSALVKVGETKVIAGVKAELMTPNYFRIPGDRGLIEVSIESTPHANLDFDSRGGDDLASDVSKKLRALCNIRDLMDLKPLCVIPDEQVWVLYVDILVVGYGGNLIDVASIATIAALSNTKLQKVLKVHTENDVQEIEFSDDPHDVMTLDVSKLPVLFTLYRVGNEFIVDATREEEACSKVKLVLAVSPGGIKSVEEFGGYGSLHFDSINDAFEMGQDMGMKLQKEVIEALQLESTLTKKKKCLYST